jgi:hypothetical protein
MTEEEFEARSQRTGKDLEGKIDASSAKIQAIFRDMRDKLIVRLAEGPDKFNEFFYLNLLKDVNRWMDESRDKTINEVKDLQDEIVDSVTEIDRNLEEMGITIGMPAASIQAIEFLTGFSAAERIKRMTDDMKSKVRALLNDGLLGLKTPFEIQQKIAGSIEDAGPFGSIVRRAEMIVRTELVGAYDKLAQQRYERIEATKPGLMEKEWMHSGNTQNPRKNHLALDGDRIGINETWNVGGHEALGPHAANLPAKEVVGCGCTTRLVFAKTGLTASLPLFGDVWIQSFQVNG